MKQPIIERKKSMYGIKRRSARSMRKSAELEKRQRCMNMRRPSIYIIRWNVRYKRFSCKGEGGRGHIRYTEGIA